MSQRYFHISPFTNRERILREGLMAHTLTVSRWWAIKDQPLGNYVTDEAGIGIYQEYLKRQYPHAISNYTQRQRELGHAPPRAHPEAWDVFALDATGLSLLTDTGFPWANCFCIPEHVGPERISLFRPAPFTLRQAAAASPQS